MKAVCQLLLLGHMRSADGLQVQIGTTIGCAPHLGVQARVLRSKLHQLIPVGAGPVCGLLQGLQDFRQQRPLLLGKVAVGHVVGRGGQARLGDGVHQRPCAIALLGNRKVRIPDHPGIDIAASLMADPIIEPESYTDAAAASMARKADDYVAPASPESAEDYPDILLILSESFYDFDLVTDLQADTDIMPVTKNLTNAVYGHTISPHVGGGTNSTEYEMLTSNSLILMPSITPFNWLNLYNANSVVSYLKGLGYTTMAAHPYTNSNYRRDSAWLALGFDETHFESDFPTKETYGDRPYQTDSATYRDWEKMYEMYCGNEE